MMSYSEIRRVNQDEVFNSERGAPSSELMQEENSGSTVVASGIGSLVPRLFPGYPTYARQ